VNAKQLVDGFRGSRPRAADLAEVVSFAVLIDPTFLRKARLELLPDSDAGLEADLWLSPLVKSRSTEGITFLPEVAAELRARVAKNKQRSDNAWTLTSGERHQYLPPTLVLEERINHLSIDESEEAAREIDELLSSVLAAMSAGGRDGLASWAARAFANFPTSVRRRSTAKMVAAGASLRLGLDPRLAIGESLPAWLRFVAPAQLPVESIGVQLAPGVLRFDATKNPAGQLLRLPATRPYLIDVSWTEGDGQTERRQLALRAGEMQTIEVGTGDVQLRTVDGETYELRLGGTAPPDVRHHIIDFEHVLRRADMNQPVDVSPIGITLVTGDPGSGKTTMLASLCRQRMLQGAACAMHFFESGTPRLEYWDLAQRSLIAQLMTHYDAPSWAVTMRLPEFLRMITSQVGTGPVYIVLDNVDLVQRGFSVGDVLDPLMMELPSQFAIVASATKPDRLQVDRDTVHVIELPPRKATGRLAIPLQGTAPRRYFDVLAVARAPLTLAVNDKIQAQTGLVSSSVFRPGTVFTKHLGEDCIALADEDLRSRIVGGLDDKRKRLAHEVLADALEKIEDVTWYRIRHAAWHWLQSGNPTRAQAILTSSEWLQRSIELFGASITADIVEESRDATATGSAIAPNPLNLLATALRGEQHRANEAPAEIAPLLYSTLRRDGRNEAVVEKALGLTPGDLRLRIASYEKKSGRVRWRAPGPVAAIHARDDEITAVIRCANAWMLIDADDRAQTILAPRMTASAVLDQETMTGDAEGTVTFWGPSAQIVTRVAAHRAEVTHVVFADDAAYSCAADGSIVRWERVGRGGRKLASRLDAGSGISAAAAFGSTLIIGCRSGDIFEIERAEPIRHPRAHDGVVTAITMARNLIVSTGADRMLRACEPHRPDNARKVESGHAMGIAGMAVVQDRLLVAATYAADRTVRIWHIDDFGRPPAFAAELVGHHAAVTAAAFGPQTGGPWLVTGDADGVVMRWDEEFDPIATHHRHSGPVRAIAFRKGEILTAGDDARIDRCDFDLVAKPGGGVTACVSSSHAIVACSDVESTLWTARDQSAHKAASTSVALHPEEQRALLWREGANVATEWRVGGKDNRLGPFDDDILACGYVDDTPAIVLADNTVHVGKEVIGGHDAEITAIVETADGVITGADDGTVWLSATEKGLMLNTQIAGLTALAARMNVVAAGSRNGDIALWDGITPLFRGRHDASVSHLAFAGDLLVSAGEDNVAAIWNYRTRSRVATCAGHRDRITALVVDDRSSRIYTASLDRSVRAWDFAGKQIGIVYGDFPFSAMALIPKGVMPGDVLAGDDAGAYFALRYRGDEEPAQPTRPARRAVPRKATKKPLPRKSFSSRPSRKMGSRKK
jgi:WD40 repeat protein